MDQHSSQLEVLLEFLSHFHLILVGLEGVGIGISQVDVIEEVEETLSLDQLGDNPLLSGLFILLLFLDLLHGQIFADPLNDSGFRLDRRAILEVELLGQLRVLDDGILAEREHNSEVISALLVQDVDVVDGVQQLLVLLAHRLADHARPRKRLTPVVFNLSGSEVAVGLLDLLLTEVLAQVLELALNNRPPPSSNVRNLY